MRQHVFQGFFSYSHHDAHADEKLVQAFTDTLEFRVSAKLTNARFSVWRDVGGLRLGGRWNENIAHEIDSSAVFIVLLSPKWIESEYCMKEYDYFCDNVEKKRDVGEYVAPLLIREIESQRKHFDSEQKRTYNSIQARQYIKTLSTDFLAQNEDSRLQLIDKVADDIAGMIERLRQPPALITDGEQSQSSPRTRRRAEFDARAHNFRHVDMISAAEVVLDAVNGSQPRSVFAHIDFLPRMYLQSGNARIEFGIRRALLSLEDRSGGNSLRRSEELRTGPEGRQNAYYINSRGISNGITLCIDPIPGSSTLKELPLPPAEGENRLSKVAIAAPNSDVNSISATLSVNLSPEGLFIFSGEDENRASPVTMRKIAAIVNAAVEKEESNNTGMIERSVPVTER